jgi:hypothetical protein
VRGGLLEVRRADDGGCAALHQRARGSGMRGNAPPWLEGPVYRGTHEGMAELEFARNRSRPNEVTIV